MQVRELLVPMKMVIEGDVTVKSIDRAVRQACHRMKRRGTGWTRKGAADITGVRLDMVAPRASQCEPGWRTP
jgi:hypothetical protein